MLRNNGIQNFRSPYLKGPLPALSLDFINASALDSRVTFTRSTTATYTNSSGVLTSSAINSPRFDYDPTTLQSLGLFREEARTNILLNSLLDGTNLSTQIVTTTATPYTLSFYGTGTIVLSGTNISTQVGTGAYPSRKVFTFTPTAGALTLTVTGTVQYAQLEAGAFVTSFIPTAGSQVTRAQDIAKITGTNLTSWYNASQGTLYEEITLNSTASFPSMPNFYDSSVPNTNNIDIWYGSGDNLASAGVRASGTSYPASNIYVAFTPPATGKFGFSFVSGQGYFSVNGSSPTSISPLVVPTIDTFALFGGDNNYFYAGGSTYLKKISYYSTALTSAQLQTLTT